VHGADSSVKDEEDLPRHRPIITIWTILAVVVFYFAYVTYSRGDQQPALVLALVGVLLTYMGLSGGTKYEI
jgi:hypothetical protein